MCMNMSVCMAAQDRDRTDHQLPNHSVTFWGSWNPSPADGERGEGERERRERERERERESSVVN